MADAGVSEKREAVPHLIPPVIVKAIIAIQKDLGPFTKTAKNSAYGSSYVPLEEITPLAHQLLTKHKIALLQPMTSDANGQAAIETILVHESGKSFSRTTKLALKQVDPQAHGSAVTYTRRYALMAMLGFTGEGEDDDGNKGSSVQTPPTEEQIRELKMLMVLLSYSQADLSKVINSIRTQDAAGLALVKYRELASKKQKQLGVMPDDDDGGEVAADESSEPEPTSLEGFKRRLKALRLATPTHEKKVIQTATGAPFITKVMDKPERIEALDNFLKALESGVHQLEAEFYAPRKEEIIVNEKVA